jgi:hypothetical protein
MMDRAGDASSAAPAWSGSDQGSAPRRRRRSRVEATARRPSDIGKNRRPTNGLGFQRFVGFRLTLFYKHPYLGTVREMRYFTRLPDTWAGALAHLATVRSFPYDHAN